MSRDKRRSFLTSFASEAIVLHKYLLSDLICLLSVVESLDVNFCVILLSWFCSSGSQLWNYDCSYCSHWFALEIDAEFQSKRHILQCSRALLFFFLMCKVAHQVLKLKPHVPGPQWRLRAWRIISQEEMLRELAHSSLEKRRVWGNLINVYKYVKGRNEKGGVKLFLLACSKMTNRHDKKAVGTNKELQFGTCIFSPISGPQWKILMLTLHSLILPYTALILQRLLYFHYMHKLHQNLMSSFSGL